MMTLQSKRGNLILGPTVKVGSSSAARVSPTRIITVAQANGDYTTITEALAAAVALTPTASNPVLVRVAPGTYAEADMTIPAHIQVSAFDGDRDSVIVDATGGTAAFNLSADSSIRSIKITNGGYALRGTEAGNSRADDVRAVDTAGYLWDTSGAVLIGANLRAEKTAGGAGGVGFEASGGGIITGRVLNAQATAGNEFADAFKVDGAGSRIESIFLIATGCQDALDVSAGGLCKAVKLAAEPTVAGVRTNNGTVSLDSLGVAAGSQSFDVIAENAADTIEAFFGEYDEAKVSIAAGAEFLGSAFSTNPNDRSLRVNGELHVGSEDRPAETALGGGDSHTRGMRVLTNTSGEAGTWAEITDEVKVSGDGLSAALFPGLGADNTVYVGAPYAFPGVKLIIDTALTLGAGEVVPEYWDGATWQQFPIMSADADAPYLSYGESALTRVNDEQVRFGDMTGWAQKTLNGIFAYWARYRIASAITTAPVLDQIKIHTHRTEINGDGFFEQFGNAEPERLLLAHRKLTEPLTGFTPGDADIRISPNITIQGQGNEFAGNRKDGFGGILEVPAGLDTSRPITLLVGWSPSSNASGDVEFELVTSVAGDGDVLDGTLPETTTAKIVSVPANEQDELRLTEIEFTAPSALPGSLLAFVIFRDSTVGNADDTYSGNVNVAYIELSGSVWR